MYNDNFTWLSYVVVFVLAGMGSVALGSWVSECLSKTMGKIMTITGIAIMVYIPIRAFIELR